MPLETNPLAATATESTLNFVPTSLLRVRAFLFEHGMPIIPWATAAEVLEDLHEVLRSHKSDDAFWQSVHELILAFDLDLRRPNADGSPGTSLEGVAEQALIEEIRARIDGEQTPNGNFLSLSRRLTQACLPVLLLFAGAATVSCGARTDDLSDQNAGTSTGTGGTPGYSVKGTGGTGIFVLPTGGASSGPPVICRGGNAGTGVPAPMDAGVQGPLSMTDVRSIAEQCISPGPTQELVLSCLSTLNTSWQVGIEGMLNCSDCEQAAQYLANLIQPCASLEDTRFTRCIIDPRSCNNTMYLGVRMF